MGGRWWRCPQRASITPKTIAACAGRICARPVFDLFFMHIAILGAGIIGVTTAYELAADGHQVTVFERHASS